jgi:hypothetical protein
MFSSCSKWNNQGMNYRRVLEHQKISNAWISMIAVRRISCESVRTLPSIRKRKELMWISGDCIEQQQHSFYSARLLFQEFQTMQRVILPILRRHLSRLARLLVLRLKLTCRSTDPGVCAFYLRRARLRTSAISQKGKPDVARAGVGSGDVWNSW